MPDDVAPLDAAELAAFVVPPDEPVPPSALAVESDSALVPADSELFAELDEEVDEEFDEEVDDDESDEPVVSAAAQP